MGWSAAFLAWGEMIMSQFCTNCGSPIGAGARFCEQCGQQVEGPVTSSVRPPSDVLTAWTGPAPEVAAPTPVPPGSPVSPHRTLRRRRTIALLGMLAVLSAGAGVYVGLPGRSPAGAAEGPSSPTGSAAGPSPSPTSAAEAAELRR